ncbi:hypothetical protein M3205_10790 [Cytobacillus firmus]|uniref:hypothetical protein n=1 Tax=Cytobacillus firmus TaxID=1399 RepID=UPI002040B9BA|nr:hypothetical protein [Cytobacillus firmus]MCM3706225.1 hypothetical protein [Cytobacillus firmus]
MSSLLFLLPFKEGTIDIITSEVNRVPDPAIYDKVRFDPSNVLESICKNNHKLSAFPQGSAAFFYEN